MKFDGDFNRWRIPSDGNDDDDKRQNDDGPQDDEERPRRKRSRDDDDDRRQSKRAAHDPTSAVYVHRACDKATRISGEDFYAVADPFALVTETLCCSCDAHDSLSNFEWLGHRRSIGSWRRAVRAKAPVALFPIRFLLLPLIFGMLGGVIGSSFIRPAGFPIGLLVGILLGEMILSTSLNRMFFRNWYAKYRRDAAKYSRNDKDE